MSTATAIEPIDIIQTVCDFFEADKSEVLSGERLWLSTIPKVRSVAIYCIVRILKTEYCDIADEFGFNDTEPVGDYFFAATNRHGQTSMRVLRHVERELGVKRAR